MIKLLTSLYLCMICHFHHAQQIYHFWDTSFYLLALSSLTPWHLLKSHLVSPANSSRVTCPPSCFMTGIFYESTVGLPAPKGQTARQQRSEWMAHFLAMVWWRGYSSSSLSSRLSVTRHTDRANLSVSNHCLLALLHVLHTIWVIMSCCQCDSSPQKTQITQKGSVGAVVDFILYGVKQWVTTGYCWALNVKGSHPIWRWLSGICISQCWISLLSSFIHL